MTTLADINKTLESQTKILGAKQTYTSHRVDALAESFDDFFTMVKGDSGDELEAEREQRENDVERKVRDDAQRDGKPGRFFDFDLGNLFQAGFLGGLLRNLPFRLIVTTLAAMLADEVGEQVKKMTGSDVLGNIAEWSTMGGAFGFLFGGVKGGILGAAIGAIFSEAARDKYAEILEEQFGLSAKSAETGAMVAAAALSMATLFLPKVIPLLFGPTGLILAAVAGIGVAISKYSTDEEFRKTVNEGFASVEEAIGKIMAQIQDFLINAFKGIKDSIITAGKNLLNTIPGISKFITTDDEKQLYKEQRPAEAQELETVENRIAEIVGITGTTSPSNIADPGLSAELDRLQKRRETLVENRDNFLNSSDANIQGNLGQIIKDKTAKYKDDTPPVFMPDETGGFSDGMPSVSRVPQQRAIQLNDAITMDQKRAMQGVSYVDASSPTVVNNAGDSTFVSNSAPEANDPRAILL